MSANDVLLYTIDTSSDVLVDEIYGHVSAVGYGWVWFGSKASIEQIERRALYDLKVAAYLDGADGVIGVRTAISFFPGFLMFRGCAIHVSGTSVTFKEDE